MEKPQFTEENVKAYLDECIMVWAERAKPAVRDKIDSTIVVSHMNMLQIIRRDLFGETLQLEATELLTSLLMSSGARINRRTKKLDAQIKED